MPDDLTEPLHIADLGPVQVLAGERSRTVLGRRALMLIARLAIDEGLSLDTADLIDAIWPDVDRPSTAKQSLANTVAELRKRTAPGLIETTSSGYRMGSRVTSDRRSFIDEVAIAELTLAGDPADALARADSALLRWRGEPWPGLHDEWKIDADRHRLRLTHARAEATRAGALTRLGRYSEAADTLARLVDQSPFDERLWNDFATALGGLGRRTEALRVIERARSSLRTVGLDTNAALERTERLLIGGGAEQSRQHTSIERTASEAGSDVLQRAVVLWEQGRDDDALNELHRCPTILGADDVRRLSRIIRTVDRTDSWMRCMWRDLISLRARLPGRAERTLISMDAYALELSPDGADLALAEAKRLANADESVRALRVAFMTHLGVPDADLDEIVRRLASIEHDEAMIEAARFQAIVAARAGRFEDLTQLLAYYDEVVTSLRPNWLDDFASLSTVVLETSRADSSANPRRGERELLPILYNTYTVDVARLWQRLSASRPLDQTTEILLATVAPTVPPDTEAAFRTLAAWTSNDDRAPALLDALADTVANHPDHRYFSMAPIVLGRSALQTRNREHAACAIARIEPWSGLQLGLWPIDLIHGAADDLLDELATV